MAGLLGHKPDGICDHTIAIVTNIEMIREIVTRVYIHPVRIKVSALECQLNALGGAMFKEDKLIFCPECGEKIDWTEIEAKIGENIWKK